MRALRRILTVLFALLLLAWFLLRPTFTEDETLKELIELAVTRGLVSCVFLLTLYELFPSVMHLTCGPSRRKEGESPRAWLRRMGKITLMSLPWIAIAVNNLPILPLLRGDAGVSAPPSYILLFALGCLGIGIFEETAFRGVVFLSFLKKRGSSPLQIFTSIVLTSAVFGLFHLVNLLEGGNPGAVLLQVGYSFLIGGMCAICMLATGTIWLPIFIHALYDFNGYLVPKLGEGIIWTPSSIALTAVVGVLVAAYTVAVLLKVRFRAEELIGTEDED